MPANVLADRVMVTSTTTGTGSYSLGSAVAGFLDFALAGITTGQRVPYLVVNDLASPTQWEIGEGVWTSGAPATLSRALVIRNHTGAATAVNWAAGTRYVILAASARRLLYRDDSGHLSLGVTGRITELAAGLIGTDAARLDQVGWQEISETVVSSPTGSVVLTMPTNFTRARVEYQDVVASVAGQFFARVSVDNAVSYLTAATDYQRTIFYAGGAGGTVTFSQGGQSSIWDLTAAVATTAGFFGDIEVQLGTGARAMQGRSVFFDSSANQRIAMNGGVVLGGAGAAITHLLLAIVGGNVNSGRFRLLGGRT